ncbi:MAG: hypothetical protein WBE71_00980 [Xanthobacteraceae bacterium]
MKGFLGAGGLFNGIVHDEDFPAGRGLFEYHQQRDGKHGLRDCRCRLYVPESTRREARRIVGYNFFTEQMLAHSCTQVAGDDTCAPASPVTELFTSNDIQFNSLRVGLSAEFMLSDRVKFVADAA